MSMQDNLRICFCRVPKVRMLKKSWTNVSPGYAPTNASVFIRLALGVYGGSKIDKGNSATDVVDCWKIGVNSV